MFFTLIKKKIVLSIYRFIFSELHTENSLLSVSVSLRGLLQELQTILLALLSLCLDFTLTEAFTSSTFQWKLHFTHSHYSIPHLLLFFVSCYAPLPSPGHSNTVVYIFSHWLLINPVCIIVLDQTFIHSLIFNHLIFSRSQGPARRVGHPRTLYSVYRRQAVGLSHV